MGDGGWELGVGFVACSAAAGLKPSATFTKPTFVGWNRLPGTLWVPAFVDRTEGFSPAGVGPPRHSSKGGDG